MSKKFDRLDFSLSAFGALATAVATYFAYQSVVASNQSVSVARCQERKTALAPSIDFLNDFLLDPHVENLSWDFHNGLSRELMPGAAVRRELGRPIWGEPHVCAISGKAAKPNVAPDKSSVLGHLTISNGASTAIISATSSASISSGQQYDDVDCLIDRANKMAAWLDTNPTGGRLKASEIIEEKQKPMRNGAQGFTPFTCRPAVQPEACIAFQAGLNEIVQAAYRVRDLLAEKASKCDL